MTAFEKVKELGGTVDSRINWCVASFPDENSTQEFIEWAEGKYELRTGMKTIVRFRE